MVIRKTVCRDCDNAIPHNTECCLATCQQIPSIITEIPIVCFVY